jgi:GNAT superfamily N-acetyltransferase
MTTDIRPATSYDIPAIWALIEELAIYEKAPEAFVLSINQLASDYKNGLFSCLVASVNEEVVGMALYYPRYSTWKGKTIHLEDFVVRESFRKYGIGTLLFNAFLKDALAQHPGRIEWTVLEWNQPAIQFYKKVGAKLDPEWMLGQLDPAAVKQYLNRNS